ncbi:DASH complex, subunit Spc34 [Sodiomyces alkalinus F11]|uniref:DASH complex subunit SPC34 n=1 Tax=Sodiomyces alkalinus (strain CBS 110278 / VKM F-3762 / F11) TaxID=1314773 RepID=A0A3N2PMU4_SODAK|nr:DASH complex, subunit Spc34 [Sodiomyces alkalinus F11]ROT35799.1 DASH complex, subunit Spc34 [Sodiomyces alkalinus F11]
MALINAHLEQIALSCQGINSLPFPPPKIFTNALLHNNDITSLIRDTEPHERALFSVPPPLPSTTQSSIAKPEGDRRKTVFAVSSGEVTAGGGITGRPARRNTAVAAVLGGELHSKLSRRPYGSGSGGNGDVRGGGAKNDVDVDILLRGAEKLCGVYAPPGALERISTLRARWARSGATLEYYETKVAEQTEALEALNRGYWMDEGEREDGREEEGTWDEGDDGMTEEDLRAEEEEVRELERKKRELQERLRAMEKDLGGLLHM